MKIAIQQHLVRILESMGIADVLPAVEVPEDPTHGDYTTNVAMLLSRQLKKAPIQIANDLKNAIQKDQTLSDAGIIERVEVAGPGFINLLVNEATIINQIDRVLKTKNAYGFVLNDGFSDTDTAESKPTVASKKEAKNESLHEAPAASLQREKIDQKAAKNSRKNAAPESLDRQNKKNETTSDSNIIPESGNKRIMIEFADPNPFKEFHIGHMRNITLGESYSRLVESTGNIVRRVNYQGDVGMHVAKSLWGLESLAKDGVDVSGEGLSVREKAALLGRAYAVGAKAFEKNEQAKADIIALNKKIYANDPSLQSAWKQGRQWSLDYFDTVYARLGTRFERFYFESEVAPFGMQLVLDHIKDGIFEESDGAVIYCGEKVGLHTRVFVSKEHYATYEAKDLGLAPLKYSEWPYDLSIIMTGNEQSEYFKVMLAALAEINLDLAQKTRHMPFGMVNLKSGKMSSRTGNVITADWLIGEAKKNIEIILSKNESKYTKEEQEHIAEVAAIGAIKYSMLKVGATSDIAFDLEASVSFDGDSGPYLQYTYARAQSVLRKAECKNEDIKLKPEITLVSEERLLARDIMQFPDVVADAAANFTPNTICTYLFQLTQAFNLFYAKCPIVGNDTRLGLTAATAQVIKNGLYLLGIDALEYM